MVSPLWRPVGQFGTFTMPAGAGEDRNMDERAGKEQPSLLMVDEAAQFLRVDAKTVYRLIDQNELKAALIGRVYRIERKDLLDFVQKSKIRVQKAPKKKY